MSAAAGSGPAWEEEAATKRSVGGVPALSPQLSANKHRGAAGWHTRVVGTPWCTLEQSHHLQLCRSERILPGKISTAMQYASVPGDIRHSFELSLFPLHTIA